VKRSVQDNGSGAANIRRGRGLEIVHALSRCHRYIHILNWEAVQPTAIYRKLVSEEPAPFLGFNVDLLRRFMPDARPAYVDHDGLAMPPVSLALNERAIDRH
jgi:hypothetical protein